MTWLGGPLDVDGLAVRAVRAALDAAAELAEARGLRRPDVSLSAEHVAVSFTSERHARVRGEPAGAGFAPLSRMLRCAGGGWARTHGNYPHHAEALCRALGIAPDPAALEAAALERTVARARGGGRRRGRLRRGAADGGRVGGASGRRRALPRRAGSCSA